MNSPHEIFKLELTDEQIVRIAAVAKSPAFSAIHDPSAMLRGANIDPGLLKKMAVAWRGSVRRPIPTK
jgi:hypothetical protein